jgi:hypothetical protein
MAYPTRAKSSRTTRRQWSIASVLLALLALIAFVSTLTPGVMAEEEAAQSRSEYGDVIGIDLGTT